MARAPVADESLSVDDSSDWLGWAEALSARVRRARQGSWWPVFTAGLLLLAASPLYLPPGSQQLPASAPVSPGTGALLSAQGLAHPLAATVFWLVAVSAWYASNALYYRRRAGARGYRTSWWPWAAVGLLVLAVLALSLPVASGLHIAPRWLPLMTSSDFTDRGFGPVLAVLVSVPLLAWAERSRVLLVVSAVLAGAWALADLYDVSNLMGSAGASFGLAANAWLLGGSFVVSGLALRTYQRAPHHQRIVLP
jgi:preprotein translocase subunit SecG